MLAAAPYLVLAVTCAVCGQVMLRRGMQIDRTGLGVVATLWAAARNPFAWLGNLALAVAMLFWLKVLSMAEIALVYPVFIGSGVMGVMVASRFLLHERVSRRRWLGTMLMLAGVIAASLESG